MTTQPTPKRWRPRFSVRTLVVLVTLVCGYAACWGPTKTRGVRDVHDYCYPQWVQAITPATASSRLPLVVSVDDHLTSLSVSAGTHGLLSRRRYYCWFFGYVAKLPYEHQQPITPSPRWSGLVNVLLP
jgi:hypothetical protein